jgi:tetratricopeptide (TPR) repeat protein
VNTLLKSACVAVLLLPASLAAQPRGPMEAAFLRAQVLRALDEKVQILLEQGKTDAAIEELRRVYSVDLPKDHPAYEMKVRLIGRLAGVYAGTGKKQEALETLKGLLAELPPGTPAEAAAWLDAGAAYRALGMSDEAIKAFDRAIELSENLARAGGRPLPPRPGGRPPGTPIPQPKGEKP